MSRETDIIEGIFDRPAGAATGVHLGIGDDAAVTELPPGTLLVTATDALVAGTHFEAAAPADSVGYRSLAVNLSDLAAMGAHPLWASLSLSLPGVNDKWVAAFAEGFFRLADETATGLIGGDTVRGPLAVTVTVQGWVPAGEYVTRTGAQPGDEIWLSGNPGAAAAGRLLASGELDIQAPDTAREELIQRFYYPEPRLALGQSLCGLATAMIDISDGVAIDCQRLLQASQVGAVMQADSLPLGRLVQAGLAAEQSRELGLCGGEDYELCFTAPADRHSDVAGLAGAIGVDATCVGTVMAGGDISWQLAGRPFNLPNSTFEHFA